MHLSRRLLVIVLLSCLLAACTPVGGNSGNVTQTQSPRAATTDPCPSVLGRSMNCYTPHALRVAYGLEALTKQGFTGKGKKVVDIVSYGSPTLQQDMDVFDRHFGLRPITIKVFSPLGPAHFDPAANKDIPGWAAETELDVQI